MKPPPDVPPGSMADRDAILRLRMVPGVGPRTFADLLDRFGSAAEVLNASASSLQSVPGVGRELASAIAAARTTVDIEDVVDQCRVHSLEWIGWGDRTYPELLNEIYDPPILLFCNGHLKPEDNLAIAIVGSRHATPYGLKMADRLARGLAHVGITVVSGLARGIDAAAHRAALDAGGRTIAILGSGLLNLYPAEHAELASKIAQQGAVLSERLPSQPARGTEFPRRNRIISGLSLGVVVVEAAERSGALISARLAMEQNREVFAVPGRADSRMSRGCHRLIRDGAKLVESVDDILEELGPLAVPATTDAGLEIRHPAELKLSEQERLILQWIGDAATDIDRIVQGTGLPTPRVLSTISVLEIRKLIKRIGGNAVTRV